MSLLPTICVGFLQLSRHLFSSSLQPWQLPVYYDCTLPPLLCNSKLFHFQNKGPNKTKILTYFRTLKHYDTYSLKNTLMLGLYNTMTPIHLKITWCWDYFDNEFARRVAIIPDQMTAILLPKKKLTFNTKNKPKHIF